MYYLSIREGDFFDLATLRKDFRILWSTGFFQYHVRRGPGRPRREIIKIAIEENPVIRMIIYKTGRKVKEADITAKLKEKDEVLLPYSSYTARPSCSR